MDKYKFNPKTMYVDILGYPRFISNDKLVHRHVMDYELRKKGKRLTFDKVVHHIDRNKMNFHPSNLQVLSPEEHFEIHRIEDGFILPHRTSFYKSSYKPKRYHHLSNNNIIFIKFFVFCLFLYIEWLILESIFQTIKSAIMSLFAPVYSYAANHQFLVIIVLLLAFFSLLVLIGLILVFFGRRITGIFRNYIEEIRESRGTKKFEPFAIAHNLSIAVLNSFIAYIKFMVSQGIYIGIMAALPLLFILSKAMKYSNYLLPVITFSSCFILPMILLIMSLLQFLILRIKKG